MNKNYLNFKIVKKKGYYEITNPQQNIIILTKKYSFGKNITWGKNIKIFNYDSTPMENLFIGDNVFIAQETTIMVLSFSVMDYTKINNHFYAHGSNPLSIGYNCWFGSSVILDTLGGLEIGNNVGVGSQTQIYSHAKFGDRLYGCRIYSLTPVVIGNDAWITPNCTITSASVASKSMILSGSVLTKSTLENHVYAGVPATDITEKIGRQFNPKLDYEDVFNKLTQYLKDFYEINKEYKRLDLIKIEMDKPNKIDNRYSYFIVKERKYTKRGSEPEIAFIKFLLPEKGKFIPLID